MYLRQRRALQNATRWKGTLYQKDVGHNHKLLSNSFDKNTDRQSGRAIVEQFNMKLAQKVHLCMRQYSVNIKYFGCLISCM